MSSCRATNANGFDASAWGGGTLEDAIVQIEPLLEGAMLAGQEPLPTCIDCGARVEARRSDCKRCPPRLAADKRRSAAARQRACRARRIERPTP